MVELLRNWQSPRVVKLGGSVLFLRGQGALGQVCRALHGQGLHCFPFPGTALDQTHMDENQDEACEQG